jgi:hypothetical protein
MFQEKYWGATAKNTQKEWQKDKEQGPRTPNWGVTTRVSGWAQSVIWMPLAVRGTPEQTRPCMKDDRFAVSFGSSSLSLECGHRLLPCAFCGIIRDSPLSNASGSPPPCENNAPGRTTVGVVSGKFSAFTPRIVQAPLRKPSHLKAHGNDGADECAMQGSCIPMTCFPCLSAVECWSGMTWGLFQCRNRRRWIWAPMYLRIFVHNVLPDSCPMQSLLCLSWTILSTKMHLHC